MSEVPIFASRQRSLSAMADALDTADDRKAKAAVAAPYTRNSQHISPRLTPKHQIIFVREGRGWADALETAAGRKAKAAVATH